jgi:RNA polymerase sigma-70 factor (ECF subfamily)
MAYEIDTRGPATSRTDTGASRGTDLAFDRLASGSVDALESLYSLEADRLFALSLWLTGSRDDAADAVQEVFVKLASRRANLGRVRRPRAYLLAMARSAALDRLRARGDAGAADDLLLEAPQASPGLAVDAQVASRYLRRLPAVQREAVYLRYFAELSFADIGRVTGVSLFTAASRCRLGLAKLRQWMGVEP